MQRNHYHNVIRKHLRSAYLLSEEKIDTVLPGFLDSLQTLMHNLEHVTATGNEDAVSRAAHAIKGALLNLGLPDLAEKAFQIEKDSAPVSTACTFPESVQELKNEIDRIV